MRLWRFSVSSTIGRQYLTPLCIRISSDWSSWAFNSSGQQFQTGRINHWKLWLTQLLTSSMVYIGLRPGVDETWYHYIHHLKSDTLFLYSLCIMHVVNDNHPYHELHCTPGLELSIFEIGKQPLNSSGAWTTADSASISGQKWCLNDEQILTDTKHPALTYKFSQKLY